MSRHDVGDARSRGLGLVFFFLHGQRQCCEVYLALLSIAAAGRYFRRLEKNVARLIEARRPPAMGYRRVACTSFPRHWPRVPTAHLAGSMLPRPIPSFIGPATKIARARMLLRLGNQTRCQLRLSVKRALRAALLFVTPKKVHHFCNESVKSTRGAVSDFKAREGGRAARRNRCAI